jgi:hypothetical protein
VDEHPLAVLEATVSEQALPGAERRQRDRHALDMAERGRVGGERRRGHSSVLGRHTVAVERRQRVPLVADGDRVGVVCDRRDDTGELVLGNRGEPVERPLELVTRDGGGVDLDQRLSSWSDGVSIVSRRSPSTPGAWSRIACIVRGTATIGLIPPLARYLLASFFLHSADRLAGGWSSGSATAGTDAWSKA